MQKGVLIINLGSPDKADKKSVRRYLREFLGDPYVINLPTVMRWVLVNMIIVPFRAAKSTAMYRSIWRSDGSPLILHSRSFTRRVQESLGAKEVDLPVELAMRYGSLSIESAVEVLQKKGVTQILVIPMYPHDTPSTTGTVINCVNRCLSRYNGLSFGTIAPFYEHGDYISALERSFREYMDGQAPIDLLLFSYHGVPLSHLPCSTEEAEKCNEHWSGSCMNDKCYKYQCYATSRALAARLQADDDSYRVVFQSRLGRGKWLEPTTHDTLCRLPVEGCKRVAVIAPSFTADCLETLYELDVEMRDLFMSHGGESFLRIDCLNDNAIWVKKMTKWIVEWNGSK